MTTKQMNLTLPENLLQKAESYVKSHGFRNVQELATEALREKVFESDYDEFLTKKELEAIDKLIEFSVSKGDIKSEQELMKALL